MSEPYIGEIRMFGGNFAPAGWAFCNGQLMPISENDTLFNLIGTTYGGDGQETFAMPNLQSRVPIHQGTNTQNGIAYQLAETGGVEIVTLTTQQMPTHRHGLAATATNQTLSPQGAFFATATSSQAGVNTYIQAAVDANLNPNSILPTGGSQPHDNLQPYLAINFIISLFGIFPTQT
jgi:microcystin-dependent protein